ncbi:hypothetical protein [Stenotrophomonas maltophilia]|uniref:hypothetical protein n=1 Tax=Stenotrophomonas maltophilia TaxID=40324 RepID=UPI00163AFF8A|nr:hypothetical protein [Stenotrophomonas maltophilia]EKU9976032.1 hypothetical protein [Stenotrophomonas maltophilia]
MSLHIKPVLRRYWFGHPIYFECHRHGYGYRRRLLWVELVVDYIYLVDGNQVSLW